MLPMLVNFFMSHFPSISTYVPRVFNPPAFPISYPRGSVSYRRRARRALEQRPRWSDSPRIDPGWDLQRNEALASLYSFIYNSLSNPPLWIKRSWLEWIYTSSKKDIQPSSCEKKYSYP